MREVRTGPDGLYAESGCVHFGGGSVYVEVAQVLDAAVVTRLTATKLKDLLREGPWHIPGSSGKKKDETLAMVLALLDLSPSPPPPAPVS